jgi:hypothetical protein
MFYVPELSKDLDKIAVLVEQFCIDIGMSDEIEDLSATDKLLTLTLKDGSILHVATPVSLSLPWRACAVLPGHVVVDLLTPNVEYDGYRLAAWIAEQAFMMLDFGRVA